MLSPSLSLELSEGREGEVEPFSGRAGSVVLCRSWWTGGDDSVE